MVSIFFVTSFHLCKSATKIIEQCCGPCTQQLRFAHWSEGTQAMVDAKVRDPGKAADEIDISPPGIEIHQTEQRQPTFDGNIGDVLVVFSVCVH
jgi:hypothetical protein